MVIGMKEKNKLRKWIGGAGGLSRKAFLGR